jgi:PadR family transcriptional regulator PadR
MFRATTSNGANMHDQTITLAPLNGRAANHSAKNDKIRVLAHFEYTVLSTVKELGENAYPAEITRRLSTLLGRNVSLAQVFIALERLEEKEYVSSSEEKPRPERGGRRRRIFTIEDIGTRALMVTAAAFSQMSSNPKASLHDEGALKAIPT